MSPVAVRVQENGLLLVLLTGYVALMVLIAWMGKRRTHGVLDYYVGGRSLGGAALGLSFFATYASTNSYLGFSSQAYSYGAPWLLIVPAAVLLSWLSWRFIAPRLREATAALDSITLPDFIGYRFRSPTARWMASLMVIFSSLLYMTAIYKGIGHLLELLLEISYPAAMALVVVIVVLYTSVGGFHSVVRTDVVQGLIMVVAAVLLFRGFRQAAGNAGSLAALRSGESTARLFDWSASIPLGVLLGVVIASTIKFVVEPRQLSRFYALEGPAAARVGMWVSTVVFLIVFALLTPIGLLAHAIPMEVTDTDMIVPQLLVGDGVSGVQAFGAFTRAFLLLALMSAAMSSLDSVLLVVASTCQHDVVERFWTPPSEGARVWATRGYVVLLASVTAVLALRPMGGIVELTSFSGALYGACFFPAVVLGLYWQRGSGAAVMMSFVIGIVTLIGWRYTPLAGALHQIFPAMAFSTLSYVLIALLPGGDESAED